MAVLRNQTVSNNTVNYIGTLAFFCGTSCIIVMLKFGGFKASLNFYNGKRKSKEREDNSAVSMVGAYRTNRDEFFGYTNNNEPQRKTTSSSTSEQFEPPIRPVKSTSDLTKLKNLPPQLRQSNPSISQDPRGDPQIQGKNTEQNKDWKRLDAEKRVEKQRQVEQKKLEKQRLDDEKKLEKQRVDEEKKLEKQRAEERKRRERQAALEQVKREKLRKEDDKKNVKKDKRKKGLAPKPLSNPLAQVKSHYSTNTIESSISRTSGPPPYSEVPKDLVENAEDSSGNVSFSKPIDSGSWDLISQHRQQINRPVASTPDRKQVVMDLKYNFDSSTETKDNSEV